MAYEKIYGNVKTICDSGYYAHEVSGKLYGGLDWVIVSKFDNKGNETEVDGFDENNVFKCKTLYIYNANGRIERQYYYRPINDSPFVYVYNYDEKGHATGYNLYIGSDGKLDSRSIDSLDSKGNAIQDCLIEKGVMTFKSISMAYNAQGKRIGDSFTNFIDTFEDRLKYDDSGNQIEFISKKVGTSTADTVRYKYTDRDLNGNWLKKSTYKNGSLENITRRKIIYY